MRKSTELSRRRISLLLLKSGPDIATPETFCFRSRFRNLSTINLTNSTDPGFTVRCFLNDSQKHSRSGLYVADSGASWRYCFGSELGEPIYTFDLADGALDRTHASFKSLLDEWLSNIPGSVQPTF